MKSEKIRKQVTIHLCNGCGSCCRNFAYIRLSQNDVKRLETFTGLTSEDFSNNSDETGEKRFMKFCENGDCIFLNMTNGIYSCSVYEARSETCRSYPANIIQKETCRENSDRSRRQERANQLLKSHDLKSATT